MRRRVGRERVLAVAIGALIASAWEVLVRGFDVSPFLLPKPSTILVALVEGSRHGIYGRHIIYTLTETLLGFGMGSAVGLVIGTVIARSPFLERTVYPYVVAFQAMPKIAIAPLLILWLGFGMWSKVAMAAMIAVFPVMVNVITGVRAVDPELVELMHSLSATRWQMMRMVQLPAALPYVFAGLDVSILFSLLATIVAEFIGAEHGMGYLLVQMNFELNIAGVFAVLLLLAAAGVGLHLLVVSIQSRVVFWVRTNGK